MEMFGIRIGKKQMILLLIDICIIISAGYFALWLRFDMKTVPEQYMDIFFTTIALDMVLTIFIFWKFKLYHSIWSFASIVEMKRVFFACACTTMVCISYKALLGMNLPRGVYIINFIVLLCLVTACRLSVRFYRQTKNQRAIKENQKNTMIIGAGEAGFALIREFDNWAGSLNKVVCVVDDKQTKKGKFLLGKKIVGNREEIVKMAKKYDVEEIIIAIPSATSKVISSLIFECNKTGCRVRMLPPIASTLKKDMASTVRDIDVHDLIGRDTVMVNQDGIFEFIKDEVVLVTGGGGSIGSELCRQIMEQQPKKLVIFDIYENNAYDIEQELVSQYGREHLEVIIGSVRDYRRLETVFSEYRPEIVYHAAAHKHVPLMEVSPSEAIKNNCLGTWNAATLADQYNVANFVLISTDKAVKPTNIMGASKRICEMIIQDVSRNSKTRFAAVRFGNVLGSNGSVVPLFLNQIEKGGPVTVTDKEITRFFMTIPEAVSLVLQASLFAHGGEIFILDMGKPVKIYNLAESLIRAKGLEPGKDIQIDIIGLRPGEKLYEEILMEEEGLEKTENDLIFIGQPMDFDADAFSADLAKLIMDANNNDKEIKAKVEDICPTYRITENRKEKVFKLRDKKIYEEEVGTEKIEEGVTA